MFFGNYNDAVSRANYTIKERSFDSIPLDLSTRSFIPLSHFVRSRRSPPLLINTFPSSILGLLVHPRGSAR